MACTVFAGARLQTGAQTAPAYVPCPAGTYGKPLLSAPVIRSHVLLGAPPGTPGLLKAALRVANGYKNAWANTDDNRCATPQMMRYFQGFDLTTANMPPNPASPWPWPTPTSDLIPGPTFRVWVGDKVNITFFNELDQNDFAYSLDRGPTPTPVTTPSGGATPAPGPTPATGLESCDQITFKNSATTPHSGPNFGSESAAFPDCLHGSSTTNVHFHGTHTTPSTTGDNVLLFIRPALRPDPRHPKAFIPTESETAADLASFYADCNANGPPHERYASGTPGKWVSGWTKKMPPVWVAREASLLKQFDNTQPYLGQTPAPAAPGQSPIPALPPSAQLSPVNVKEISAGYWPQYHLGAVPYCFSLPATPAPMKPGNVVVPMAQAPGTHWYHAHKHGSTALNVANGMTGVFIIQGQYDIDLHNYYGPKLREQVLSVQELSPQPFPVANPLAAPQPGAARPRLSVNGRLQPLVTIYPGEVQLWRIVNTSFRDGVDFAYFAKSSTGDCSTPATASAPQWRQIAQDGVQFHVDNYKRVGKAGAEFNLAAANRADVLMKAPTQPGTYALCIRKTIIAPPDAIHSGEPPTALLTLAVTGTAMKHPMQFIPDDKFPTFPGFLKNISDAEITNPHTGKKRHRTVEFGGGNSTIGSSVVKQSRYEDGVVSQTMTLNTAEEWVVKNDATDKSHPFHIHINPFQIVELFQPTATSQSPSCAKINPEDPATFDPDAPGYKPCTARVFTGPWIWWDTFPIPIASKPTWTCIQSATTKCPAANLVKYGASCTPSTSGVANSFTCNETIAGWFRSRSRFVDFTGQYVLHCHILIHEDLGMMQLIEVTADPMAAMSHSRKTIYTHH
ncbi:MAG: multicopper oxidase domain-containing protein [Candidatus Eremiobacteraeota bacterium]|nr:multicopper oxidase domain-containing protein [Candidatus Eremiobacteraeota bacterium]